MLLVPGEALVMLRPGLAPQASGAPAIAAWVAASLGAPTVFLGAVGDDEPGRLIRATLAAAGVDPAGLKVEPGRPTATARVEYHPDGSRAFDFAVVDSAATAFGVGDLGDRPERARWIHVSGSAVLFGGPLADAAVAAVARARAAGAIVSIDPNLRAELTDPARRAVLGELCRHADVLFPSDDELTQLGLDEHELVAGGVVVCRTMAAAGARLRTPDLDVVVPAVADPDAVVDPDGAGDTFAATVVAARLHGLGWLDAVRAAARVTAEAIMVDGPMTVSLSPADLTP